MSSYLVYIYHGCHSSENGPEKKFFKVMEKSGNFMLSQGKNSHFEEKSGKIEKLTRLI